ncbi:MAG: DUF4381 domain-containing protein [Cellvibrionales bacterium]|jgi:hypothetical protein
MDPATLLEQLAPLREPAPVSWWPLAPGWWVLGVAVLVLMYWALRWLFQQRAQNRYRRQALRIIDRMIEDQHTSIEQLNKLLKSTALRGWPQNEVAGLHGNDWLIFLQESCPVAEPHWTRPLAGVYGPTPAAASPELLQSARVWIRRHQAKREGA